MTVVAKAGRRWIGGVLAMLYFIPKVPYLSQISDLAHPPVVELGYDIAYQLGKLLEEYGIFVPLFLDGPGQTVRDRICD